MRYAAQRLNARRIDRAVTRAKQADARKHARREGGTFITVRRAPVLGLLAELRLHVTRLTAEIELADDEDVKHVLDTERSEYAALAFRVQHLISREKRS